MGKVRFVFAIHNHQPVGNFDFVSEEAYQRAYLPLVAAIREHPWFKLNLHFTGGLLEWLERAHPEFMGMLKGMAASGQVEMMGGGFYEPVLALLPDEDKHGQLRKLSEFIKSRFGAAPDGIWLAERVWEPHLPRAIAGAGMKYLVVDDFHFKMAGLRDRELDGYFLTEEQGSVLKVFPGSERLRYTIPFKEPEEALRLFRELHDASPNGYPLAVMADDGEKFGVWPGTYKWVYEDGWLGRFIKALEESRDWLETTTFSEFMQCTGPKGKVYLPTCSYMEMGEWALPAHAMREYEGFLEELKGAPGFDTKRMFVKGGFFRNFLSKYPESNAMHKRMLHVSRKAHKAAKGKAGDGMLDELWKGQCNDAYWHGVFGGLYLPHLRDSVYRHLIAAEEAAEKVLAGRAWGPGYLNVEESDLDGDLKDEVMVSNRDCAILIDPAEGGTVYELDYRPIRMNLMNTLSRREEGYHCRITGSCGIGADQGQAKTIHERVTVKEDGLSDYLNYDWYRRASLIDHFLGGEADLEAFRKAQYNEAGDFVLGEYEAKVKKSGGQAKITLSRRGLASGQDVGIHKVITVAADAAGFDCEYTLKNEGRDELNTVFGSELNLSLLAPDAPDRYLEIPGHVLKARNFASAGELNNVTGIKMVDEWLGYAIDLSLGSATTLWRFPVETVSQSEAGFERVYQCTSVMPLWRVSLKPGAAWKVGMSIRITRRQRKGA